jgi:hypothetical protein
MSTKTVKKKVAILAIGRFAPPHRGHIQLIKECYIQASAMKEKSIETDSDIQDACAYCWVSPSDKEMNRPKKTENSKNPISTADKLHYLCKMIPAEDISEQVASDSGGVTSDFELKFLVSGGSNPRDEFAKLGTDRLYVQESRMEIKPAFQNTVKRNIYQFKKFHDEKNDIQIFGKNQKRFQELVETRSKTTPEGYFLPSVACINHLIAEGFNTIFCMVGSDRIDAFERYNNKLKEALGEQGYKVEFRVFGGKRGGTGNEKLLEEKEETGEIKKQQFQGPFTRLRKFKEENPLYETSNKELLDHQMKSWGGDYYSGTRVRNSAYNFETYDKENISFFIESTKEGNMDIIDVFCLLNDIRRGNDLTEVSWTRFFQSIKLSSSDQDFKKYIREIKKFQTQNSEFKIDLLRTLAKHLPRRRRIHSRSGVDKIEKFRYRGGKKTRKKSLLKKKRTRKMKERIIKFMRGPGDKKYTARIIHKKTRKIRHIHFGAKGYQQYKDSTPLKLYSSKNHGTKKRRDNYFSRHSGGIKNKKKALAKEIRKSKGLYNAKILSHKYLW